MILSENRHKNKKMYGVEFGKEKEKGMGYNLND
jgi:hypothetical protein